MWGRSFCTLRNGIMNKKTLGIIAIVVVAGGLLLASLSMKGNNDVAKTGDNSQSKTAETSSDAVVETNSVTYKGFAVVQKTIKVKKGTTVTWTNEDSAKHDVTPDQPTANFKASELFGKGGTYKMTFNTVGTFAYHCSPHPYMKGTIEVVE